MLPLEVERRLHPEPADARASRSTTSTIAVGFLMARRDRHRRQASSPTTNFAIVDFSAAALKGKPKNVEGLLFKEQEAGYLAGYLAGLWAKDNNANTISTRRRPEDPAGRPLHRGLPGRRQGGQPGHQDAERLLAGLRRPGEVQGDRAQPDRAGLEGRLPGGRRLRPRRARRGQGEGRPGHRRGRRPVLPRPAHPDLGPQEGRRGRVQRRSRAPRTGKFKGGTDVIASVKNGGIGLGKIGPAGQKYADQIKKIQDEIASGKIKDIPDTVK